MTAREHDIDRVACAMTAGAPGAGFTARVMAPIHGRPGPGFTLRVMAQLDAGRAPRRLVTRAFRPAFAAVLTLAVLAVLWMPARVAPAPPAPSLVNSVVGAPAFITPDFPPLQPVGTPRVARPARPAATVARETAPSGFITDAVGALTAPAAITLDSIHPAAAAVTALGAPAPLSIPALRIDRERP